MKEDRHPFRPLFLQSLRNLWPEPVRVNGRERLRAAAGALVGILVAGGLALWVAGATGAALWLIAPVGASAVLVFAVPASPMAQPWPVLGGNVLSSLIGI